MKILVISSRYPPYHFGGYGLRCKNIMDALAERGHEIVVLTSQKEATSLAAQLKAAYPIYRQFHLYLGGSWIDRMTMRRWSYAVGLWLVFMRELWFDWRDTAFLDRQIKQFRPDVIYLGHITNFSRAFLPYLAACKIPVVYDEGGSGLIDSWLERGVWNKLIDKISAAPSLVRGVATLNVKAVCTLSSNRLKPKWAWPHGMKIIFNSDLNRRNAIASGLPVEGANVIHSGIDTQKFKFHGKVSLSSPLVLLVPGRIEPRKGQMDAVRFLAKLGECGIEARMILVGENWAGAYYQQIQNEIKALGLEDKVSLRPMVDHEALVGLYHQADLCFFPSYFKTGFSRVPLEAMSCGCVVISYGNEGSDEIIHSGQTGFLVQPADYEAIVGVVKELLLNPGKIRPLQDAARKEVEENYSLQRYVNEIEEIVVRAGQGYQY